MLVTEKEAQNKYCTQSRRKDSFCQASQCMAFRTIEKAVTEEKGPALKGFCGLAGPPLGIGK